MRLWGEGVSRAEALREVCQHKIHHDPFMNVAPPYRVAGTEGLEVEYSDATREGDFDDFVMRIRPGTMGAQDPNVRVRRLV